MAGMLPGVELARRRRTSHHQYADSHSREPSLHHQRLQPSTTIGETALKARRRLEEKLHGSAGSRWSETQSNGQGRSFNNLATPKAQNSLIRQEKVPPRVDRKNSQREVCSICLEDFRIQEHVTGLPCSHRYHSDCLLPWLNTHPHCPYCRAHVQST